MEHAAVIHRFKQCSDVRLNKAAQSLCHGKDASWVLEHSYAVQRMNAFERIDMLPLKRPTTPS